MKNDFESSGLVLVGGKLLHKIDVTNNQNNFYSPITIKRIKFTSNNVNLLPKQNDILFKIENEIVYNKSLDYVKIQFMKYLVTKGLVNIVVLRKRQQIKNSQNSKIYNILFNNK